MQKSQNEDVWKGLLTHIRELWDRLQTPAEERQAVALVVTGSKAKVKKAVRNPKGWASSACEHSRVRSDVFTTFFLEQAYF